MYSNIHNLKNQGFSKRQIARELGIDFRTVRKYLSMEPGEFNEKTLNRERRRNLALYEGVVAGWLKQYPDMSAAQVRDWLAEHYQVSAAERTARRFVAKVREKHAIPKAKESARQYAAVTDPPMGRQMQVDLGVAWVFDAYKRRHIKLHVVAAVLSHSRYKWGSWSASPLNAARFVGELQACFEYMGGMPQEIVFDQDRLLAVDENYGDLIFTKEFEQFRAASGFAVRLCRKADPESKGRVEAVVKYFKRNFAKNRQFVGIDIWNDSFCEWLSRTGNQKEHGTTKKIPAEVFSQEILLMKPVPSARKVCNDIITRQVHKNNTVFYEGNRYSVPIGTYPKDSAVSLSVDGGRLTIKNLFGDRVIAEHELSRAKGELVAKSSHRRDKSAALEELQNSLAARFGDSEGAWAFLALIRQLKPRYARDQFSLIKKTLDGSQNPAAAGMALEYCATHNLYSAVEFRDAVAYFADKGGRGAEAETEQCGAPAIIPFETIAAVSRKRELSEYALAAKGGAL
jgi:transposase